MNNLKIEAVTLAGNDLNKRSLQTDKYTHFIDTPALHQSICEGGTNG